MLPPLDSGNTVELGQRLIEERILGIEQFQYRAVLLQDILEETFRLSHHVPPDLLVKDALCKPLVAFPEDTPHINIQSAEITRLQPLANKIPDHPIGLAVSQHPVNLRSQIVTQLPPRGQFE